MTYEVILGQDRVPGFGPALKTRFKRRAEKRRDDLNAKRLIPSYRYEVVREDGRWQVIAYQNYAKPRG